MKQAHILCFYQDLRGFLWIGTYSGLYRYDGKSFKNFNTNADSTKSLTNSTVYVIIEDNEGHLWIGTEYGLNNFDPDLETFEHYIYNSSPDNLISNNHIRTLYYDQKGLIWIGTYGGGLHVFSPGDKSFQHIELKNETSTKTEALKINTFLADQFGNFWLGTHGNGVFIYEQKSGTMKELGSSVIENNIVINKIYEDNKNNIWIGTWHRGLFKYTLKTGIVRNYRVDGTRSSLSNNNVRDIVQDEFGNIWIATFGGGINMLESGSDIIYFYKTDPFNIFTVNSDMIWSLYRDNVGVIWIGSFGDGICNFDKLKNSFQLIETRQNRVVKGNIISALEDSDGKIWVGTLGDGIYQFNIETGAFKSRYKSETPAQNIIRCIYESENNLLWFGTDNGLILFSKDKEYEHTFIHNLSDSNSILNAAIYAISEDFEGNLWIGFWGRGINYIDRNDLYKSDKKKISFKKPKDALSDNLSNASIWNIYRSRKNKIILCTDRSLGIYSPQDHSYSNLISGSISCSYEDFHGNLWIGTFGDGVIVTGVNNEFIDTLTTANGLTSKSIYNILGDDNGNIWIITDNAISKYNTTRSVLCNYVEYDGMRLEKPAFKASVHLDDGSLLIGGSNGLLKFHPGDISETFFSYPVYITDIRIFNESITGTQRFPKKFVVSDTLVVKHKENMLSFEFIAINLRTAKKVKYAYKLEGFDQKWITTNSSSNSATYTNLDGGEYTFRVKAADREEFWYKDEALLKIIVIPPVYKKTWFIVLAVICITAIFVILYNIRLNNLRKEMGVKELSLRYNEIKKENELLNVRYNKLYSEHEERKHQISNIAVQIISKNQALHNARNQLLNILSSVARPNVPRIEQLIKSLEQNLKDDNDWNKFNLNFSLIQDNFLNRFAEAFPRITHKDLKICAYIRMNMSTKQIAEMLNITQRSLETSRYRIRKKMGLRKDINLNDFIIRF
ncbi:MAG: hypothetical protein JW894_07625 [Bacteroidales bacterium]|nr:hypothetical protein [Bacteroidales bacterium]